MSYDSLLTDRCDLFHLENEEAVRGKFGIPAGDLQTDISYPDTPSMRDVSCYVVEKIQSLVQEEPNTVIYQSYLVHFPLASDIRLHDKMVWNGISLKLQQPKRVKNHHMEVMAVRKENL
ncbi:MULTISPECIES: YqbH/XkdH family protein [Bacillus]|uniref:YqbH/XkdH family protein n=1 Tax=Bacillus TaxID=1386 RepID=UPI0019312B21|nr:YqbH/XkdH family protein [Bacillus altitudinis]QRF82681.1 YqbH/XkdH family protein [Bacillus altitudinis]UUH73460.1 YqbH/XkdH family protein [Bacillus altitudinis]